MNKQMYRQNAGEGSVGVCVRGFGFRTLWHTVITGALLTATLLSGCTRDPMDYTPNEPQEPVPSGYVRTEVKLSVDENRLVNTRATDAEEKAYDKTKVYVLVFDNDPADPTLMQRPVKATVTGDRLFALLRATGDPRRIYVVTGLSDDLNTSLEAITDDQIADGSVQLSEVNDVLKTAEIRAADGGILVGGTPPSYIPMSTDLIDRTTAPTQGTASLTEISQPLKRIVARIDVACLEGTGTTAPAMPTTTFELEGVRLRSGAGWSYVLPLGQPTTAHPVEYHEVTGVAGNAIKGQIYLYQREATDITTVVVRGKYKSGESSYYRLDILNTTGNKPYNALSIDRNTKYTIRITEVKTSGYRTEEEALANSAANNIEYDVNVDNGTSHDVVSNGEYYIGSTASEYVLYGDGDQAITVATISHNAPATVQVGVVEITEVATTGGGPSNVSNPFAGAYDGTEQRADLTMTLPAALTSCTARLRLGTLTKTIKISRKAMFDLTNISEELGDKFIFAEREGTQNWISLSEEPVWHRSRTFTKSNVTSADGKLYLHLEENLTPSPRRGAIYGHKGKGATEQDRYRVKVDFFQRGTEGLIAGDFGGSWSDAGGYTGGLLISDKDVSLAYKTSNTDNDRSIVSSDYYGRTMNVAAAALADPAEYPSFNYCARLNRDLNGNGKIDDAEMKWYMPATLQLLGMKSLRPASVHTMLSSASEKGPFAAMSYKMAVYPENGAIIGFLAAWEGGEKTSLYFATRCVRDIPKVGYPRYEAGSIISNEAAPANATTSVSKRRAVTASNDLCLPGGPFTSDNETVFKRIEVSTEETTPVDWAAAYNACINKGEGWRLPTNRESIHLMLMPGFTASGQLWSGFEYVDDGGVSTRAVVYLPRFQNSPAPDEKTQRFAYRCIREIGVGTGSATLKFDANGGGGSVADMSVYGGSTVNMPAAPATMYKTIDGYNANFIGWNTEADGTGTLYPVGSPYVVGAEGSTTTLYASYLVFAPGNVVRNAADPTKFAFGVPMAEGLAFEFGSLVGLNLVTEFNAATSLSFVPAEYTSPITTYAEVPAYGHGSQPNERYDLFLDAYPGFGYNAGLGLGDVCRYMSDKGMVPAGTYWRMPTAVELWGLGASTPRMGGYTNTGDRIPHVNGTGIADGASFVGTNAPSSPTFSQVNNPPAGSVLLPTAYHLTPAGGLVYAVYKNVGEYWTSTPVWRARFTYTELTWGVHAPIEPTYALSVRCVKATKPISSYTLTFDANGGAGEPVAITGTPGSNVTIPTSLPVYDGHTFIEWNTQADGAGTAYAPGALYYTLTANVTLHAKWMAGYVIRYHGNGADSGVVPANSAPVAVNTRINVAAPGAMGKSGRYYAGWTTTPEGAGRLYSGAAQSNNTSILMQTGGLDLYAQWIGPDQIARRVVLAADGTLTITQDYSYSTTPLMFKFGSVVGITQRVHGTIFTASDVVYDPRPAGGACFPVASIPGGNTPANFPLQNATNVRQGRGDPCKLVGKTAADIAAGDVDNGLWRLPTPDEFTAMVRAGGLYTSLPGATMGGGVIHLRGGNTAADLYFLPISMEITDLYPNPKFQIIAPLYWSNGPAPSAPYNGAVLGLYIGEYKVFAKGVTTGVYPVFCVSQ